VKGRRDDRFSMLAIGISIGVANSLAFNAGRRKRASPPASARITKPIAAAAGR
jgi:hypothetical protein